MMGLLWQIWNTFWQIFMVANGQILKNNLTIWSHWLWYLQKVNLRYVESRLIVAVVILRQEFKFSRHFSVHLCKRRDEDRVSHMKGAVEAVVLDVVGVPANLKFRFFEVGKYLLFTKNMCTTRVAISVWLTSCLLVWIQLHCLCSINNWFTCRIQSWKSGDQLYSHSSPNGECSLIYICERRWRMRGPYKLTL